MPICRTCGGESPEAFRYCGQCGAPIVTEAAERRKLATLVFCDLSGSTAMGEQVDAETVRSLMLKYFHEMRGALERHGGTVEKFVGDAVLAVFGVPEAHEDDALRACRAALEMQVRLGLLNEEFAQRFGTTIALRIGVNTGEVVAGDPSDRETFVTGDPVNVAARLEQAAEPGDVLLGEATYRLVRDAVSAEPVEPLEAKGKSEPVAAYRLLEVTDFGSAVRRAGTPFTGRETQVAVLEAEFEAVVSGAGCRLATVTGEPGVGKSRLVVEFVRRIGARARVVRGTCLSYGEGITYWAVVQIIRELARIDDEHSPSEARARIEAHVAGLPHAVSIATNVAQLLGLEDGAATTEETSEAIRAFIAATAVIQPLVVIVDDIQWAEPTLLDLLAGLPAALGRAPIGILCLARPELFEHRPDWPVTVNLEPFDELDIEALIENLLGPARRETRAHLAAASGGNPLFAEELVAMLLDDDVLRLLDGVWHLDGDLNALTMPASLHALLGARLDRLEPDLRAMLERGAIEGEVFHRGAVVGLSPPDERANVHSCLERLIARDLIRPAGATFANEAAFRFKHILVRDAAYQATAKRARATLHEQFASWLELTAVARVVEYEEILGYHLEQSYLYMTELGPADAAARAVAERAAERLAAAGRRASRRGDVDAASGLFGRAVALLPVGHPARARIVVRLGEALMEAGRLAAAVSVFDDLLRSDGVDELSRMHAEVCRGEIELQQVSTAADVERLHRRAKTAIELFATQDDEQALLRASWLAYLTSMTIGRSQAAREAIDRIGVVTGSHSHPLAGRLPGMLVMNLGWGPTPVPEALEVAERVLATVRDNSAAEPLVLGAFAYLLAQADDIGAARKALDRMREITERQGQRIVLWSSWGQNAGRVELLVGDPERAENALRPCYVALRETGSAAFSSTVAGQLAHALVELGRPLEAVTYADAARDAAGDVDVLSQVLWRSAKARALVGQGDSETPFSLIDDAVDLAHTTEWPNVIGDALLDRARVLLQGGDSLMASRIAADVAQADVVYLAKGNRAGHGRALALSHHPLHRSHATTEQGGSR